MEKNKEFLDFISICYNGVDINKEIYKILSGANIYLKEYFQEFMKMFNTKDDYSTMVKCMEQVIKNKPSDEDCGEYLLRYKGYVKDCFETIAWWSKRVKTLRDLYETIKSNDLELCDGFDNAKVFTFDSMRLIFKGRAHIISKSKKEFRIRVNDKDMNIGGILIKDGKTNFIRVDCIEDEIKLLINIVTRKDYNIALVPNFNIYERDQIKDFGIKGLTNKEFFDLRYILENGIVYNSRDMLKDYRYVRNHKIKISSIFDILDKELNFNITINLLKEILKRLERLKEKELEAVFEHIKDILEQRIKSNYLYTTSLSNDLEETVRVLKSNKYIGLDEFLRVLKNGDIGRENLSSNEVALIDLDKKTKRFKKDSEKLKEIIGENKYLFISSNVQILI